MARPIKYDRRQVLLRAMHLFWSQGYNATSMPQLLKCMGLSASSFYSAFGDKRQLYEVCFELYTEGLDQLLERIKTSTKPAEAIHTYYAMLFQEHKIEHLKNGCLMINSLLEFEEIDKELHQLALNKMSLVDQAFQDCFANAIRAGNIHTSLSSDQLGQFLSIFFAGIQVKRRAGLSLIEIKSLINTFCTSIGVEPFTDENYDPKQKRLQSTTIAQKQLRQ